MSIISPFHSLSIFFRFSTSRPHSFFFLTSSHIYYKLTYYSTHCSCIVQYMPVKDINFFPRCPDKIHIEPFIFIGKHSFENVHSYCRFLVLMSAHVVASFWYVHSSYVHEQTASTIVLKMFADFNAYSQIWLVACHASIGAKANEAGQKLKKKIIQKLNNKLSSQSFKIDRKNKSTIELIKWFLICSHMPEFFLRCAFVLAGDIAVAVCLANATLYRFAHML